MSEDASNGAMFAQFMIDRQEAMERLDVEHFKSYMQKWGEGATIEGMSDQELMASMHYGRLEMMSWPEEGKELSRKWLTDNGYRMPEEFLKEGR